MSRAVQRHYDSLSLLYRLFWGEHLHHGYWAEPNQSPRSAQEQLVAVLAERAGVEPGEEVLDVGCGYGASGRWLADRLACRVTGITLSRRQARFGRRRNDRLRGGNRPRVLRADAAHLPFPESSFDVVWVVECLEHLEDKPSFIRAAAHRLRPGGRLAVCSWMRGERLGPAGESLVAEVCERFLCPSLATAWDYASWCRESGLRVAFSEELTGRVRPTWDVVVRRVGRPWLAPVKALLHPSNRHFVDGFETIARAMDTRSLTYGLLVAKRSGIGLRLRPGEGQRNEARPRSRPS